MGMTTVRLFVLLAAIAQLGERQTEDLKVPGLIPGLGIWIVLGDCHTSYSFSSDCCTQLLLMCCKALWAFHALKISFALWNLFPFASQFVWQSSILSVSFGR